MTILEGHRRGIGGRSPRRPSGRWSALVGALFAALLLVAVGASAAQAAEEPHDTVEFGCTSVTINYAGFPGGETTIVSEKVKIVSEKGTTKIFKSFQFTGSNASDTIPVAVPPGHSSMDVFAKWSTNGVRGGHDQPLKGGIRCAANPQFSIVKNQRVGGKGSYSTETLPAGKVGEKVEYGIVVTNTGNVPLTLNSFKDPNCDEGTLTGGAAELAPYPNGKTTYFCSHTLTEADHLAGRFCNLATVTGTPPEGEGEPVTHESNEACTELPTPKNKVEFTCKGITFNFEGFPNESGNTVKMRIRVDGVFTPPKPAFQEYTFNGPTGSYTFPLNLSPGHHGVDGYATWNTHGFRGGSDQTLRNGINCEAEPGE